MLVFVSRVVLEWSALLCGCGGVCGVDVGVVWGVIADVCSVFGCICGNGVGGVGGVAVDGVCIHGVVCIYGV